ncbi:MAG: DUF1700 domain-containing protein [Clostridia bacterium]|jgi:uncharacterized membrane protein|nr:DUF1700 domain-containing protein [Clostridia bacterium]MBT7122112.1 DUF1700 domain-containing protein [Clostridia bacterium]
MKKQEFMKKLSAHLKKMPKLDRDDILADFEEYFDAAQAENENEETLCERLGDPKKIAKEYYMQKYIEEANMQKSFKSMSRAFAASASLGIVNFFYVLCVVIVGYIVISALYIAICSIGLGAIAAFIAGIIFGGMYGPLALWLVLFGSVALLALSVLGFIGIMKLAKLFRKANMRFLNMTRKGIIRRKNYE